MIDDTGFLWMLVCWSGAVGCILFLMWWSARRKESRDD